MSFQNQEGQIHWKVHFTSPIEKVYQALSTDKGRMSFWAERTLETNGLIEFRFLNYPAINCKILDKEIPSLFRIEYFDSVVTFALESTQDKGTELTLINTMFDPEEKNEITAGWVSVLLAMKAAVDFGIDLRNHNPNRTWNKGYLDN